MSKPGDKQASAAEIEERIEYVIDLISAGIPHRRIDKGVIDKYGCSKRTAERVRKAATERLRKYSQAFEEIAFEATYSRLEEILYRASRNGDLKTMLQAIEQQRKLYGLDFGLPQAIELLQKSGYKIIEDG